MNDFNAHIPDNCLSLTELHAVARGASDRDEHSANCLRCQALLRLIESQQLSDALDPVDAPIEVENDYLAGLAAAQVPDRTAPHRWVFGELLSVSASDRGELLLCTLLATVEADQVLQVAPVTTETAMAGEWDLLIPGDESALGYDVAVEVWNHGPVNSDQVAERLGTISSDAAAELRPLYDAVYDDERPDVRAGVPVESEADPRLAFQLSETDRARTYWIDPEGPAEIDVVEAEDAEREVETVVDPAAGTGAFVAVSIGQWFDHWLQETGNDAEDLARESSWRLSEVQLLLANRLAEEPRLFDVDYFGRVLIATKIDQYEAEEMLYEHLSPAIFPETWPTEPTSAVFRRGTRAASSGWHRVAVGRQSGQETEGQRQVFKRWVSEVVGVLAADQGD
jgi:hypothetical protein